MVKQEKKYVRIQSKMTIQVTCGLQCEDVTNPDAHVADRLKISPQWPTAMVIIKEGVGFYPAAIASWNTVKALAEDDILTIGDYTDEPGTEKEEVEKTATNLNDAMDKFAEQAAKLAEKKTLADIAKE